MKVLTKCLAAIRVWMGRSWLQLNQDGKMEWLWIFEPPDPDDISYLTLNGVVFPQVELVCNFGVLLDPQLLLKEPVASRGGGFTQICLMYQLYLCLDQEAFIMITHALVASHWDYCNVGLPLKTTLKFHLVQNATVRTVM